MGGADTKGAVVAAQRVIVELGEGRPIVAESEFKIVAIEAGGGFADDAGSLDARRLVEGGETAGSDVVREVFGHGGHSIV